MSGNLESGRINQVLAEAQRCAVQDAIKKARASSYICYVPTRNSSTVPVPSSSTNLQGKITSCSVITSEQASSIAAQTLRGVPESVRIKYLQQKSQSNFAPYNDPLRRFVQYQGPQIQIQCPPLPTEVLNAFLPKASVRCDTLALLASSGPPNSIVR